MVYITLGTLFIMVFGIELEMCIRDRDKAVSLVLALKGPAAELPQKVPPDSQNTYAEFIKALELRYGDRYMRDVYYAQLRTCLLYTS